MRAYRPQNAVHDPCGGNLSKVYCKLILVALSRSCSKTQPRDESHRLPSKIFLTCTATVGRASTGDRGIGVDDDRENESVGGVSPIGDALWVGPGRQGGKDEADGKVLPAEAFTSEDDRWMSLTKTEKRRLWLRRRRAGEFFFRSEFKGLVHAVRMYSKRETNRTFGRLRVVICIDQP